MLITINQNNESNANPDLLNLKEAYVDGGPVMKRFRAASMGRASRLRRPTSHITIVLADKKLERFLLGQKTHPVGYRLSVNKKWNSNWFASKNDFSSELEEDVRIRKYISHRLPNAGISKVEIARTSKKVTIAIYTARPGIVIGRGGEEVNRLKKELRQLTGKKMLKLTFLKLRDLSLTPHLLGRILHIN